MSHFLLPTYISANSTRIFMKLWTETPGVQFYYPTFSYPGGLPTNGYYKTWVCTKYQQMPLSLPIQLGSLWNFKLKLMRYQIIIPTCLNLVGYPQMATIIHWEVRKPSSALSIYITSSYLFSQVASEHSVLVNLEKIREVEHICPLHLMMHKT